MILLVTFKNIEDDFYIEIVPAKAKTLGNALKFSNFFNTLRSKFVICRCVRSPLELELQRSFNLSDSLFLMERDCMEYIEDCPSICQSFQLCRERLLSPISTKFLKSGSEKKMTLFTTPSQLMRRNFTLILVLGSIRFISRHTVPEIKTICFNEFKVSLSSSR